MMLTATQTLMRGRYRVACTALAARPGNTAWLLIFDNVDRQHVAQGGHSDAYDTYDAYDVRCYLSGAD